MELVFVLIILSILGILMIKYIDGDFSKQTNCDHEFYQDTQITVLKCHKCGMKGRYMGTRNLYPNKP